MSTTVNSPFSDKALAALLERYQCPTSFAAVRTILMGYISTPILEVSPLAAFASLWGGQMPEIESEAEAQSLMEALIQGLWSRLAEHQSSRRPFMLLRAPVTANRAELQTLAVSRKQEIAGFLSGLFGKEEELLMPEKADAAVRMLVQIHGMFSAALVALSGAADAASEADLAKLARHAQQMTAVAETQINKTIQACKRARARTHREPMAALPTPSPVSRWSADEPMFMKSQLSRQLTRHGVTVQVEIYGDGTGKWILEVVDQENASHVWDDHFETDHGRLRRRTVPWRTRPWNSWPVLQVLATCIKAVEESLRRMSAIYFAKDRAGRCARNAWRRNSRPSQGHAAGPLHHWCRSIDWPGRSHPAPPL